MRFSALVALAAIACIDSNDYLGVKAACSPFIASIRRKMRSTDSLVTNFRSTTTSSKVEAWSRDLQFSRRYVVDVE